MGKAGTHRPNGGFSLASQMKPGKPLKKASQRAKSLANRDIRLGRPGLVGIVRRSKV
jgi:hypothetical protein